MQIQCEHSQGPMKCQPCTPEFVSASLLPHGWSWAAQTQLESAGTPEEAKDTQSHTGLDTELRWRHVETQNQDDDGGFNLLTSASRDDMNLRTTCLRYSKLISRESLRSAVLVTLVLKDGGLWEDAGGGSGQTLSCLSARISGDFSRASVSGSDFSLCDDVMNEVKFISNAKVEQNLSAEFNLTSSFCSVLFSSAILCCSCLMVCNVMGHFREASQTGSAKWHCTC